jgi:DNA-binding MarR family transcriptional regulator
VEIEKVIKATSPMDMATKTVINLMYTSRVIEERILACLKPFDISTQQYNVLRILRGQKNNPCNVSQLQSRMIDKNSNTTRLIDKLLTKGLVKRQVCAQNRRKVELFITTNGLNTLEQLDPIILKANQDLLTQLDNSQLEILNTNLNTIRN